MSEDCCENVTAVASNFGKALLNIAFPFMGSLADAISDQRNLNLDPYNYNKKFRYKLSRNSAVATFLPTMVGLGLMGFSAAGDFSTSTEVAKIFSLDDFNGYLSHITGVPYLDGFILAEYLLCFVLLAMLMRGLAFLFTVYHQAKAETESLLPPEGARPVDDEDDGTMLEEEPDKFRKAKAAFFPYAILGNTIRGCTKGKAADRGEHSTTHRTMTPHTASAHRPYSSAYFEPRAPTASPAPALTPENVPLDSNLGSKGGSFGVRRRVRDVVVDPRGGIQSTGGRRQL